ncbi:MAG: hypothetical protein ACPGUZ_01670 [Holosporaceae bacterium]
MKDIAFFTLLCMCFGNLPLAALKGKDDNTPENPKPVAAAANPSTSQATTPGVAKAAPRKVVILPPEPFTLDAKALAILQSKAPEHAEKKEDLLAHAVRAVELKIEGPLALPDDTTALMALFVNVKALRMGGAVTASTLPLLPCGDKLESLALGYQTIHYDNPDSLEISWFTTPLKTLEACFAIKHLKRLRTFESWDLLTLDGSAPAEQALFEHIVQNNPQLSKIILSGCLSEDAVRILATLPLSELDLIESEINDTQLALLPFDTLEELRLRGPNTLTHLTPLRKSRLRVFGLPENTCFNDAFFEVIDSMRNLAFLDLYDCILSDADVKPLLRFASQLQTLKLRKHRISNEMRQQLRDAFGDKVQIW